ncbi:ImuA family protein [Maricaulis maris]|uniref:ImuA family protein n=1 Tax=Maricaulis maris TaxID=74318 RepID=UPI003A95988D
MPSFKDIFPPKIARVHEVYGPGAVIFAALAAPKEKSVLWVHERWKSVAINPQGLLPFLDPSHVLIAGAPDQTSALSVAEEALRSGVIPFVVTEISRPMDLREGRRLQLAAKTGHATGLCIIPEGMGSNAADTRWMATPVFDPSKNDSTLIRVKLIKNKTGTCGAWDVEWDPKTHCVHVVSSVSE